MFQHGYGLIFFRFRRQCSDTAILQFAIESLRLLQRAIENYHVALYMSYFATSDRHMGQRRVRGAFRKREPSCDASLGERKKKQVAYFASDTQTRMRITVDARMLTTEKAICRIRADVLSETSLISVACVRSTDERPGQPYKVQMQFLA